MTDDNIYNLDDRRRMRDLVADIAALGSHPAGVPLTVGDLNPLLDAMLVVLEAVERAFEREDQLVARLKSLDAPPPL
jgi:hypothetical protein